MEKPQTSVKVLMWAGLTIALLPILFFTYPGIFVTYPGIIVTTFMFPYLVPVVSVLFLSVGIIMLIAGLSMRLKLEPSFTFSLKKYALLSIIILLLGLAVPVAFFLLTHPDVSLRL